MSAPPPSIARAIVSLATEPADRPWILADLDEEFSELAESDPGRARRWYWLQAFASIAPLARRRMRRHPPTHVPARPEMLTGFQSDVRHAIRSALRTPAPTIAMLITMALGIGATAAISTVVWKVLLQPLPLQDPGRVLAVYRSTVGTGTIIPSVAYPDLMDWRERSTLLAGIAPYTGGQSTLLEPDGPIAVNATQVGEDFFSVLRPRFALGRPFDHRDFDEGAAGVAILSGAMWQREFGGDPGIVGRLIELESGRVTVVGVVRPDEFTLPLGGADLWVPLHVATTGPTSWMSARGTQWLEAVARVRPGASVAAAMAELRAIDAAVQREFPRSSNVETVLGVTPLQEHIAGPVRTMLLFLSGAAVIVLLVVCTNIANLRLVQAQSRQRELAMRLVLGAGLGRIRRQVLTESMMLALTGALSGLLLAKPILRGVLALYPGGLPRADEVRLDPTVIAWSLAVAAIAGLLFALPQMLHVVKLDASRAVRDGERGMSSRGVSAARRALVVVQLALSVVMLVSSGLLVRTFVQVTRVSPGFDARGVLSFTVSAPSRRFPTVEASEQLYRQISDRLQALPGVRMVATTNAVPLTFNPWRNGVSRPNATAGTAAIPVNVRLVSPGYLELMRMSVRRGRTIGQQDGESAPRVVLISEDLAAELYPGDDPIGKLLRVDGPNERTIVGVVGRVHHKSLTTPADNEVYVPFAQAGARASRVVTVRTDGDPAQLAEAVRDEVRTVDPRLPIRSMQPLAAVVSAAIAPQRFRAALIGALAVLTLALAVVGVYGVMSYAVSERTRELGIRVALGESPGRIRQRVVADGLLLAALGTGIGAAGAWAATRALRSFLFEVVPADPWTLGCAAGVLALVTLIAADGPARRASRVDPITAIRGNGQW